MTQRSRTTSPSPHASRHSVRTVIGRPLRRSEDLFQQRDALDMMRHREDTNLLSVNAILCGRLRSGGETGL